MRAGRSETGERALFRSITHPESGDHVAATHYVESWQKTGNVVLTVNGSA